MPLDYVAENVAPERGAEFTLQGLLSKAAETALEVVQTRATGGTPVGSAFPTGQVNPERVASDPVPVVSSSSNAVAAAAKFLPWVIGGGIIVAITLAALALRRR